MHLPHFTYKNAKAITIFNLFILILIFVLKNVFSYPAITSPLQELQEKVVEGGEIIGFIFLLTFFAGFIVSGIYAFFVSHRMRLTRGTKPFGIFYFAFMLWLALFSLVDLFLFIIMLFIGKFINDSIAVILGIVITDAVNFFALLLMFYYLVLYNDNLKLQGYLQFKRWIKDFLRGESPYRVRSLISWGVLGYIGFFPLFTITVVLNEVLLQYLGFDVPIQPIVEFSLRNVSFFISIFLFISVVFVAPLFEEIIMRGLVFRGLLKRFSFINALFFSAIVFGAFHFNLFSFVPISVFGILLALLYARTGSLVPPIVAHMLFNGVNFVGLELLKNVT